MSDEAFAARMASLALGANEKPVSEWTLEELQQLPKRPWRIEVECHSLVLLPAEGTYESGYLNIDVVGVNENLRPICRLNGHADVLSFLGERVQLPPFNIDRLAGSGLFHIFADAHGYKLIAGSALSSQFFRFEKR